MPPVENTARMPDVAAQTNPLAAPALDWVGMGDIDVPVTLSDGSSPPVRSPARVNAFVNLKRGDVRGIHMSRLYLHVDSALAAEPLTPCSIRRLLRAFLDSHAELSDRAMLRVAFDHMIRRPALKSDNSGWKAYPVTITAVLDKAQFSLELGFSVAYSSTCPCSAALARQLIQERFRADFAHAEALDFERVIAWLGSEEGICATPHSQRSIADVRVRLAPSFGFPLVDLIDSIETALATPVQTAVKREDEQEFARLNAMNLMFCEDAARRMRVALEADERVSDFWLRASHHESLHAHDAVAIATKGIAGGYASV